MKKKLLSFIIVIAIIASMSGCTKEQLKELTSVNNLTKFDILNMDYPEYIGDKPEVRVAILSTLYTFHNAIGLSLLKQYDSRMYTDDYDRYIEDGQELIINEYIEDDYGYWIDIRKAIANLFNRFGLVDYLDVDHIMMDMGYLQQYGKTAWESASDGEILSFCEEEILNRMKNEDCDMFLDMFDPGNHYRAGSSAHLNLFMLFQSQYYAPAIYDAYLENNPDAELKDIDGNTLKLCDLGKYLNSKYGEYDIDTIEFSEDALVDHLQNKDNLYIPAFYNVRKDYFTEETGKVIEKYQSKYAKQFKNLEGNEWPVHKYTNQLVFFSYANDSDKNTYSGPKNNLKKRANFVPTDSVYLQPFDIEFIFEVADSKQGKKKYEYDNDECILAFNFKSAIQTGIYPISLNGKISEKRKYKESDEYYDNAHSYDDDDYDDEEDEDEDYDDYDGETDWEYTDWD